MSPANPFEPDGLDGLDAAEGSRSFVIPALVFGGLFAGMILWGALAGEAPAPARAKRRGGLRGLGSGRSFPRSRGEGSDLATDIRTTFESGMRLVRKLAAGADDHADRDAQAQRARRYHSKLYTLQNRADVGSPEYVACSDLGLELGDAIQKAVDENKERYKKSLHDEQMKLTQEHRENVRSRPR